MAHENRMEYGRQARDKAKRTGLTEHDIYMEDVIEEERRINGYYRKPKPPNKILNWAANIFLIALTAWYGFCIFFIILPRLLD